MYGGWIPDNVPPVPPVPPVPRVSPKGGPGSGAEATRRTHYMATQSYIFLIYKNNLPNWDNFWFGLHTRPVRGVPRVGRPVYSGWIVGFGTCDRDVQIWVRPGGASVSVEK